MKTRKIISIWIYIFLIPVFIVYSQDVTVNDILISKSDTNQIRELITLGNRNKNPDSSQWFYKQAFNLSQKLGVKSYLPKLYNLIGDQYSNKGLYDTALVLYQKAKILNKNIGNDKELANSYNNIGTIYHYRGEFDKAISYYLKEIISKKKK